MDHDDGFGGDQCGSPHGWLVLLGSGFPMGFFFFFFFFFFLIWVFVPVGFWWVVGSGGVVGMWRRHKFLIGGLGIFGYFLRFSGNFLQPGFQMGGMGF